MLKERILITDIILYIWNYSELMKKIKRCNDIRKTCSYNRHVFVFDGYFCKSISNSVHRAFAWSPTLSSTFRLDVTNVGGGAIFTQHEHSK